jgi:hypothetical protein
MYFITENGLNMNKEKTASNNLEGEVRWLAVALDFIEQHRTISSNVICIANERYGILTSDMFCRMRNTSNLKTIQDFVFAVKMSQIFLSETC